PFKITPNTEVFFTGGNRGAVLDALIYAINSGEGIVKVVGEVGSGKTMLCRMLQSILPDKIESIFLANPSVAPEDVLHAIAFELQLKLPKNADRLKVMQVLQTHLLARHAAGKQVVIFVEEAQGMPLATLEEIRLLSNLETKHDKLLQIVLFGQPELDENLNQINIRQLRERITHSFNLAPLQTKEIGEYLMFRLRAAGYFGPPMFTDAAIKKLANAADGLVRRVNILADKALLAAFAENVYQVTPKHVQAAIGDSEFGMEAAKKQAKNLQLSMWVGLVVFGLALGYAVSNWLQRSTDTLAQAQSTVIENAKTSTQTVDIKTADPTAKVNAPSSPAQTVLVNNAQEINSQLNSDILSSRLAATTAWLASQNPSTVTIQLMGASSDAQLKSDLEVLSQQVELDNIFVYRTSVAKNGTSNLPFLTVLYGSFANRLEAIQALKKLPLELQKNRPQLRTVAGVLQEIK
ncbi:MAG TPA: AAA family ATPase, partial [Methylotenera sp.]|nr:AAA family ATPase [Methylotenera sp.]